MTTKACHTGTARLSRENYNEKYAAKAGFYYLPMHGAQITGFTSARLGLAAYCTQAINGHTDSLFTIGSQEEGLERYLEIMKRAGYTEPTEGLGAFKLELQNVSGWFLDGGCMP